MLEFFLMMDLLLSKNVFFKKRLFIKNGDQKECWLRKVVHLDHMKKNEFWPLIKGLTYCHFSRYFWNQNNNVIWKMAFYASSLNIHENIRDYFE